MSGRTHISGLVFLVLALSASFSRAAQSGMARLVPADARLYLEVRDWNGLVASPAGALLSEMLESLVPAPAAQPAGSQPAATQPASTPAGATQPQTAPSIPGPLTWRHRIAAHIGVTQPGMLEQLASGRLVLAADGWDTLGQAILIAQPANPAELDRMLRAMDAAPNGPIRVYKLANDHELAFDGTCAVIGRRSPPGGLLARTLALWASRHGVALSDTADYRDRVRLLPSGSQVLVYFTGRTRAGQGAALPTILWPAEWNQFESLAATLTFSPSGVTIDTSTYPSRPITAAANPDAHSLLAHLPASTLLAWTHSIDYAARYARLSDVNSQETFGFYRGVLENGMPRGSLNTGCLAHLRGETLLTLSQIARPAATSPADTQPSLWVPAFTVAVKTANQEVVAATLQHTFQNLLMLLNVQPSPEGPLRIESLPIGPGGGAVYTVEVGRLLRHKRGGELLAQLQLSWAVTDGLVVVGTATQAVRELILARRGQAPLLAETFPRPRSDLPGTRTRMIAQPRLVSELLVSWAQSIAENPALFAQSDWWTRFHSVRAVSLYQLGAIPGQVNAGAVQIAFVIPQLPAAERLRAGDTILAVEGKPLEAGDPFASLELLLATRPRSNAIQFKILREGCEETIDLPIAPPTPPRQTDAVEVFQQASRLLRLFSSARYSTATPEPGAMTTRLDLQFAPATAAR